VGFHLNLLGLLSLLSLLSHLRTSFLFRLCNATVLA
jgi:hypothetical protein